MDIAEIKQQRQEILAELYGRRLAEEDGTNSYTCSLGLAMGFCFSANVDVELDESSCIFNLKLLADLGYITKPLDRIRMTAQGILAYEKTL